MDKKILITGKRNIDSFSNKKKKRLESEKWQNKELLLDNKKQINILNKLYLNEKYQGCDNVKSAIVKKIKGYENQDIKKNKLNQRKLIKYEDLLEILVISKLKCYYCKCDCLLMYDNVREKKQWTLDRLNNDEGHNKNNLLIACLTCNLRRKLMHTERYAFTKQLTIIKQD